MCKNLLDNAVYHAVSLNDTLKGQGNENQGDGIKQGRKFAAKVVMYRLMVSISMFRLPKRMPRMPYRNSVTQYAGAVMYNVLYGRKQ